MNVTTGTPCIDYCAVSCLCSSVNSKKMPGGHKLCELNFEDDETETASLHNVPDYDYFGLIMTNVQCKVGKVAAVVLFWPTALN